MAARAAVVAVLDTGTCDTKMGFAGNADPTFALPTLVAQPVLAGGAGAGDALADMSFCIGDEAVARAGVAGWRIGSPIQHGLVEDWDGMERLWQHCIYRYLRVDPAETGFLLTEPAGNPPESREWTAEVLFETFGAAQLHIAEQGSLALLASGGTGADTGLVIDCGAGVTRVVPIVGGYVLSHAVRHTPLGGRAVTQFMLDCLRRRREPLRPAGSALAYAERAKERRCYVSRDSGAELARYEADPAAHTARYEEEGGAATGIIGLGYERFLGPEIFFQPDLFGSGAPSLPELADEVIWSCPIDCRRPLYANIVLSGGTTLLPGFADRLQAELRAIVDERSLRQRKQSASAAPAGGFEVNVVSHDHQRFAVWRGGSILGASPEFADVAKTRQQYEEEGPGVMRATALFQPLY